MVSVSINETVLMQWLQSLSHLSQHAPLFIWDESSSVVFIDDMSCDISIFMFLQWSLAIGLSVLVSCIANAALSGSRAREVISSRIRVCFTVFVIMSIKLAVIALIRNGISVFSYRHLRGVIVQMGVFTIVIPR